MYCDEFQARVDRGTARIGIRIDRAMKAGPIQARAIRLIQAAISDPNRRQEVLRFAADNKFNALVVDLKPETGRIVNETKVAAAHEIGAVHSRVQIGAILSEMDALGLHSIARICAFRDPY